MKNVLLKAGLQFAELSLLCVINTWSGNRLKERGNSIVRDLGNGIKFGMNKFKKDK